MHLVMGELLAFREMLRAEHHHPGFRVPYPTLNLGHVHGGDNPNRICPQCEIHFDLRTLPGMDLEGTRQALRRRIRDALAESDLEVEFLPLFEGVGALETPRDRPIVQAVEALTGRESEAVAFSTEGPFLQELGIDTVILGPGHIEQAHQPDEYLELAMLPKTLDILDALIRRFCVEPEQAQEAKRT
jgi:acetylornithine deacetylase